MKRVILFVFIIIIFANHLSYSQDVFPSDNAKWTELLSFDYELPDGVPRPPDRYISYALQGDTVIDGIKRGKLYFSPDITGNDTELMGFIHTDAGKVYFRFTEDSGSMPHYVRLCDYIDRWDIRDIMLYDFTLEINSVVDTDCYKGVVSDIEYVMIGNRERKKFGFFFKGPMPNWDYWDYWIEGMGCTRNLFYPIEANDVADVESKMLICFSQNDEVLWLNPEYIDCTTPRWFNNLNRVKTTSTQIYPNPMNGDEILIESSSPLQQIKIYEAKGRLLQDISARGQLHHSLSGQSLTGGIYFVKIILQNGDVEVKKLIIK